MAFNAGELVATIRLSGLPEYERGLDNAGQKLRSTSSIAQGVQKTIGAVFATGATGAAVAVTATAAYASSLFRTGVAYNTLQQTSRAALTTLTGSAEAANAQMDKLDAFARTSPFSKSVFIQAQQQLLGFGVEAQKVIPTLSAVGDAVAAVGGSNQQISEIVAIMAKISSSGKITAEDLNEFGARGLDAATLIGQGMNKTGGEIRTAISEGAIGAGQALDILVAQMGSKFEGASAGVKQTFAGTVDRIKAANREIGASLAEPFVSQQGGGYFVLWGNQVADVLRGVLTQTGPVVSILENRALPAFAGLTTFLDRANASVRRWDASDLESTLYSIEAYAPGVIALGGAFGILGAQSLPIVGALFRGINPLVGGISALVASSPELRAELGGLLAAFSPLIPVAGDLVRVISGGLNAAVPVAADVLGVLASVAGPLVGIIAQIPAPLLAAVAGFLAVRNVLGPLADAAGQSDTALGRVAESVSAFARTAQTETVFVAGATGQISAMSGTAAAMSGVMGRAGTAIVGVGNSLKAAFISNPIGLALLVISGAAAALTAAFSDQAQKAQEADERMAGYRDTLAETTNAITDATESQVRSNLAAAEAEELANKIGIGYDQVVQAALGNKDAIEAVDAAMTKYNETNGDYTRGVTGAVVPGTVRWSEETNKLREAIENERTAIEGARQAQELYRESVRQAAAAMSDAERSNGRLNDAVAVARDTSADATERIRALRQAIDELKGGSLSAAEAQIKQAEVNNSLAESLTAVDDQGRKAFQTLLDGAGAIDLSTSGGTNLANEMLSASDAYLSVASSAYDAAVAQGKTLPEATKAAETAAQGYIDTLRQTLKESGLTQAQIEGLIGTYFALPSTVSTLVTDDGTISTTEQKILSLSEQIKKTPDKEVIVSEPFSPAIMQRLESLGFKVRNLPDGSIAVSASGVSNVEAALANLARTRTAIIRAVNVNASTPGVDRAQADGGMFAGGVKAFANGGGTGFPSGIYRGRPGAIHKFAEPETIWETYISGRPSARARNQMILAKTAPLLGMMVVPAVKPRAFANGGTTASPDVMLDERRAGAQVQLTLINPVSRDIVDDARTASELIGAALDV